MEEEFDDCPFFSPDFQALRLTPYPNNEANIDILMKELNILFAGVSNYVYGKEFGKNWHIHAVFYAPDFDKKAKESFKNELYEFLGNVIPNWDSTKKGNSTFSCEVCKDVTTAVAYAQKNKDVVVSGSDRWMEFAEDCKKKVS